MALWWVTLYCTYNELHIKIALMYYFCLHSILMLQNKTKNSEHKKKKHLTDPDSL